MSLAEALLKQQLEFVQSELEEYKKKEENLKKTNVFIKSHRSQ